MKEILVLQEGMTDVRVERTKDYAEKLKEVVASGQEDRYNIPHSRGCISSASVRQFVTFVPFPAGQTMPGRCN